MPLGHWMECGFGGGAVGLYLSQGGARPLLGLTCSHNPHQGRPGEICVVGPKGQKVSCECLRGGEWVPG